MGILRGQLTMDEIKLLSQQSIDNFVCDIGRRAGLAAIKEDGL